MKEKLVENVPTGNVLSMDHIIMERRKLPQVDFIAADHQVFMMTNNGKLVILKSLYIYTSHFIFCFIFCIIFLFSFILFYFTFLFDFKIIFPCDKIFFIDQCFLSAHASILLITFFYSLTYTKELSAKFLRCIKL